jgi:hypothetical protein
MDFYSVNNVGASDHVFADFDVFSTELEGTINLTNSILTITSSDRVADEISSKLSGKWGNRADTLDLALHRIFCRNIFYGIPPLVDKADHADKHIFWELSANSQSLDIVVYLKEEQTGIQHITLIKDINAAGTVEEKRIAAGLPSTVKLADSISLTPVDPDPSGIKAGHALVFYSVIDLKQIMVPIREKIYENNIREIITHSDIFVDNKINPTLSQYKDNNGDNVFSNELKFCSCAEANYVSLSLENRKTSVLIADKAESSMSKAKVVIGSMLFVSAIAVALPLFNGFKTMVSSMGTMDNNMGIMSSHMGNLAGTISNMDSTMVKMVSGIQNMKTSMDTMNTSFNDMNTHVSLMTTHTDTMAKDTSRLSNSVDSMIKPMQSLDDQTKNINRNFSYMNDTGDRFREPMDFFNRMTPFWK